MKYINLQQHWEVDRVQNPTADSDIKLTANWLLTGVSGGYKNGFKNGDARRMFETFKTKVLKAMDEGAYYIETNPIESVFIKAGFDQNGGNPQDSAWIKIAEDAFLGATDTIPEEIKVEEVKAEK